MNQSQRSGQKHLLCSIDTSKGFSVQSYASEYKKGSSSINKYLSKINNAVDRLASVGHSVLDADHVEAIFNGLPQEYTFIISVTLDERATRLRRLNLYF